MPSGLPSPDQLQNQLVRGFSIDTSIYQELAFRFHEGQLAILDQQVPKWLSLYTSDVVLRETLRHAMHKPRESIKRLGASVESVSTLVDVNLSKVSETLAKLDLEKRATQLVNARFDRFSKSLRGAMVDTSGVSTEKLFEAYFSSIAPFASTGSKKSEFPDAAALFSIESLANEKGIQIILISKDKGWHEFAAGSERLYCVDSVEALASLFESTSPLAEAIKEKIGALIESEDESFLSSVREHLEDALHQVHWYVDTSTEYEGGTVDVEIDEADLRYIGLEDESLRLWTHSEDGKSCVVEVAADIECDFKYSARFEIYNSARDKMYEAGNETGEEQSSAHLSLLLTLEGDLLSDPVDKWDMKLEIADPIVYVSFPPMEPAWFKFGYKELYQPRK